MRCTRLLVLSTILIAGCATVGPVSSPLYFPPNPSAILLKHQGDILVNGSVSTGGETFSAAYGLTPHLGLLASGSMILHKSGDPSGDQYSGELGAGFFDTLTSRHLCSEFYGGIGWGSGHVVVSGYIGGLDLDYQQFSGNENIQFWNAWVQGATGYSRGNFSFMIFLRLARVNIYHDITEESVWNPYLWYGESVRYDTSISRSSSLWSATPGLEVRYGLDHIQLVADLFGSLIVSNDEGKDTPLMASLGLCYKF